VDGVGKSRKSTNKDRSGSPQETITMSKSKTGRPQTQWIVEKEARSAYKAMLVTTGRAKQYEPLIIKSPYWSVRYAHDVLKKRWKEAEPVIATDGLMAYQYAIHVIKGAFPEAERVVSSDAEWAYLYAKQALKAFFPLGEKAIARHPEWASRYAGDIIKGRWRKAEKAIAKESKWMLHYAKKAIKGQLPDAMHNKMVMLSITGDPHAKKYGSTKKFMTPPAPKKPKKGKG
jgi:hypothetical protein